MNELKEDIKILKSNIKKAIEYKDWLSLAYFKKELMLDYVELDKLK